MIQNTLYFEYIWLDANNNFRSKVKTVKNVQTVSVNSLEIWNFDGSSTNQASTRDSEVLLKPYNICFGGLKSTNFNNYYYVFCECLNPDGSPHKTNTRSKAVEYFNQESIKNIHPMFGIEQEFFIFKDGLPLIWNEENPVPQGDYYCGNGAKNVTKAREYLDEVMYVLDSWGINCTGYNFEVAPGQMEIQIRECGIDAADNLIAARFILTRLAEQRGWDVDFKPKPDFLNSDKWNGSGCHVNFSTTDMRLCIDNNNKYSSLKKTAELIFIMEKNHTNDIAFFGSENNKLRLGGKNEASSYDTFNYGVANRGCSIRIPRTFVINLFGYIEDRRPGSDMDPYIVTKIISSYALKENQPAEYTDEELSKINKILNDIMNKHNEHHNVYKNINSQNN